MVFHSGEQKMQAHYGMQEKMAGIGPRVIRKHMPVQHQQFFEDLPFIFTAYPDSNGFPAASLLWNQPGFIQSTPDSLSIEARWMQGDWSAPIQVGQQIGLLGLMIENRRRNRMNGRILKTHETGFTVQVDQSFGNCPKYIQTQTREVRIAGPSQVEPAEFNPDLWNWINAAHTFFIASVNESGVDISHRGGKNFIWQDAGKMVFPDFSGNFFFNTLGNLLEDPRCGLLFLDSQNGNVLQMQGEAEILLDPKAYNYSKAQAFIRIQPRRAQWIRNILPWRWTLTQFSPNLS